MKLLSYFFRHECKALAWFSSMFAHYGMWLVLFMTADRVIAIKAPLRAPSLCTPKRAKRSVLALLVATCAFTVPYYTQSDISNNGKLCTGLAVQDTLSLVYSWVNIVMGCFFPFIALLTMNSIIIHAMLRRGSHLVEGQKKDDDKRSAENRQLTFMLLLVTFTFLALICPQYLRYFVYSFKSQSTSPFAFAEYVLVVHISNKMYFTNNSVNFLLYCMGGTKFRNDLKELLGCGGQGKKGLGGSSSGGTENTYTSAKTSRV